MSLVLPAELRAALAPADPFEALMTRCGEVHRRGAGRETLRVEIAGRGYFLKRHTGAGWREILKNLLRGRAPVLGAGPEVRALEHLPALDIRVPRLIGHGRRGWSPARRQSFVLMEALDGMTSLEDLCRDWARTPPLAALKRALLLEVAGIARRLHGAGCNHRDFYLCHFLLAQLPAPGQRPLLYLIDLHRVQQRTRIPRRWRVKDLGGLYFSALDAGLSRRDCLRFVRAYHGRPLPEVLPAQRRLWRAVSRRARSLYRKAHARTPRLPVPAP